MQQQQQPKPTASSSNGFVEVENPLMGLRLKGVLDLMDELDLKQHLPQEKAQELESMCAEMRSRTPTDRLGPRVAEFNVDFNVSLKDLVGFGGLIKERDVSLMHHYSYERDPGTAPCIVWPLAAVDKTTNLDLKADPEPASGEELLAELAQLTIPVSARCTVLRNDFENLLKEELKVGCSLSEEHAHAQQNIAPDNKVVQNYMRETKNGRLIYTMPLKKGLRAEKSAWPLMPILSDAELSLLSTQGLVKRSSETIRRGVTRIKYAEMRQFVEHNKGVQIVQRVDSQSEKKTSSSSSYYYMPEEHGLSEVLKRHMPSVISNVRVYSLEIGVNQAKTFLRLPESCYEDLLAKCFNELSIASSRESVPRDMHFWVGYKSMGEDWDDPIEIEALKSLGDEEYNKKRLIRLRVTVCWLALVKNKEDLFIAQKPTVGAWLPTACSYVDGVIYTQKALPTEEKKNTTDAPSPDQEPVATASAMSSTPVLRNIPARSLPYYLKDSLVLRRCIKNDDSTDPPQTTPYAVKLIEL